MDDVIAVVVERDLGTPPERVDRITGGLLHETYEVRCDGGRYVLQFESDADDDRADSLARGVGCYRALQDADVPVPDVVTTDGETPDGRAYALVERPPGASGERDVSRERTRAAGRVLARIHATFGFERAGWLDFEDRRPTVEPFEVSHARRVRRSAAESAAALRDGGLDAAGHAVERLLDRPGDDLPTDVRPVLCHGDLSPDNVLFDAEAVTGVLDFDRARAGGAGRDLARAANAFWMHDPCTDWDPRRALYDGYREERDPPAGFGQIEPFYRVETLATSVAGLLALDELSSYERGFYDERIREAVERADGAG